MPGGSNALTMALEGRFMCEASERGAPGPSTAAGGLFSRDVEPQRPGLPDTLGWAISNFQVDRVTAEVTRALAARSIESILLKGPTIATWLYSASDRPRLYGDSDLLIRHCDWEPAQIAMRNLGF